MLAENLIQSDHEGVRTGGPLNGAVDAQRDPTGAFNNTAHLLKGLVLVRKELQPQLTKNCVKAVGRGGQVQSAAIYPSYRCSFALYATSNGQHAGIQVETCDLAATYPLGRQASHDTSPASDVQHSFAGTELREIDEILRPF